MGYIYKNITGDTATNLDVQEIDNSSSSSSSSSYSGSSSNSNNKYKSKLSNIILCNRHVADSVTLDLYLYKTEMTDSRSKVGENGNWNSLESTESSYYLLNNVVIPNGTTLTLDSSYLNFDRGVYDLYIKLNNADSAVDIILN
tara:strand:- start:646 stop:1074 length:429 start_codon:yes stop_codon:yes gene_type:complete